MGETEQPHEKYAVLIQDFIDEENKPFWKAYKVPADNFPSFQRAMDSLHETPLPLEDAIDNALEDFGAECMDDGYNFPAPEQELLARANAEDTQSLDNVPDIGLP